MLARRNRKDEFNQVAVKRWADLDESREPLLTTNFVVAEVLDGLAGWAGFEHVKAEASADNIITNSARATAADEYSRSAARTLALVEATILSLALISGEFS